MDYEEETRRLGLTRIGPPKPLDEARTSLTSDLEFFLPPAPADALTIHESHEERAALGRDPADQPNKVDAPSSPSISLRTANRGCDALHRALPPVPMGHIRAQRQPWPSSRVT